MPVFRGPAVLLEGRLYHLPIPAGYPVLYLDGPGPVHGELLRFADPRAALGEMDRLEGCPGLFERSAVEVVCGGDTVPVWIYRFPSDRPIPPDALPVTGGDWRSADFPDSPVVARHQQ
ncbi:MAG TPA: gamma-glutamylcyclotransferase family protein [bacterium]|nr:gamma-glutamylcyclotransferase family protein [bacterium]